MAPGIYVEGDSARLVQCVSNVLMNAAKYTDSGGTVSVVLTADDQRAIVSVSDTGIGIPEELLPRVFDLFVQDARSLDRSQGGLGIGLSVVRKLIEMHGGEVSATSAGAGQGSTFKIILPRVSAPVSARVASAVVGARTALKVLVADDNQDAADTLAMLSPARFSDVGNRALGRTLRSYQRYLYVKLESLLVTVETQFTPTGRYSMS
jgi:Histidine kinase-, DNA gyrase B-, and HSP90-like ATPase